MLNSGAFRDIAALKCASKFVWSQLAYHHFQAVYSSSNYTVTISGTKYDPNCATIVLFL